jgi:hypothetical protein
MGIEKSGQALVELIVALVVILVLFAGILQVSSLGVHQSRAMVEARRLAGMKSMLDVSSFSGPLYIEAVTTGPDNTSYSRDDAVISGNPAVFVSGITTFSRPADLNQYRTNNAVTVIDGSAFPQFMFGLVQGEKTETIGLMPVISQMVYRADSVEVRGSAWMTWTKGIY